MQSASEKAEADTLKGMIIYDIYLYLFVTIGEYFAGF